jgi:hypothetical protein
MTTEDTVCMPAETFNMLLKGNTQAISDYIDEKKAQRSIGFYAIVISVNFVVLSAAVAFGTWIMA